MNIQHHLKSVVLATTLAFSAGAMQTAVAYTSNANYKIVNVANWDALNVRSGAGTEYRVINEIPANSSGIKVTNSEKSMNGSTWVKISWNGNKGWVNKRYLTIATARVAPVSEVVNYANNYTQQSNNYTRSNRGSTHTHPANECTLSKSHSHAGAAGHKHSYSCKGKGRQQVSRNQQPAQNNNYGNIKQNYYNPTPVATYNPRPTTNTDIYGNYRRVAATNTNIGSHRHPANECTLAKSHSHAGAKAGHKHRYSCKGKGRSQQQVTRQRTYYGGSLQHTHGKSQCASAINHTHNSVNKVHRHECASSARRVSTAGGRHTHAANSLTNAQTHSHPYQDRNHSHSYGRR